MEWLKKKKMKNQDSEDIDKTADWVRRTQIGDRYSSNPLHQSTSSAISCILLDSPWREMEWDNRDYMKFSLKKLKVSNPDVKQFHILAFGAEGAGKSSFINSAVSIFLGRMANVAPVSVGGESFTKTFRHHYIKDPKSQSILPFAFSDVMGLEKGGSDGVKVEDVINILEGHIMDGYQFDRREPCSEDDVYYKSNPMLSDTIHCLVSVISSGTVSLIDEAIVKKMTKVRDKAENLGIPQVTILTKADETCPDVAKDIKQIFWCKKMWDKVQECSMKLGVPVNHIFPVKNYHTEQKLNDEMDVLLLSALENIMNFANDYVRWFNVDKDS